MADGIQVTLRLGNQWLGWLDERAGRAGVTRSEYMRWMVVYCSQSMPEGWRPFVGQLPPEEPNEVQPAAYWITGTIRELELDQRSGAVTADGVLYRPREVPLYRILRATDSASQYRVITGPADTDSLGGLSQEAWTHLAKGRGWE